MDDEQHPHGHHEHHDHGHHGHGPDPAVVEAVEHVRDRFGAAGLRDMIALAQREVVVAERALAELRDAVSSDEPA